jgi:Xaa-Pro aminopeptidase
MERDAERVERVRREIIEADIDALICTLPMNVLMLTAYWPVIGSSIAVFTRDGSISLLVPEDEFELARRAYANDVRTFSTGTLSELKSSIDCLIGPLSKILQQHKLDHARIGFESGAVSEPSSYAAMTLYGCSIRDLITSIAQDAALIPAGQQLARLRSVLTEMELDRLLISCVIAEHAYTEGILEVHFGLRETEVANLFRRRLSDTSEFGSSVERADGFAYCMSGENSFEASAAFQRSRQRRLSRSDIMLLHCNSYADGFWTDITRTFCLGGTNELTAKVYRAIFAAREAAFKEIRPGVQARLVDAAARDVLKQHGFGDEFVHGLGHAVGFHAIDHNAPPRLHPASPDIFEEGMVFNVEPAVYIEGVGGIRHCDMVAVTRESFELLTPFQASLDGLVLDVSDSAASGAIH